jgi:UPF0755 protein
VLTAVLPPVTDPSMRLFSRAALALAAISIIGAAGAWFWLDRAAKTPVDPEGKSKPTEFRVAKGATLNQVGQDLESAGLIASARVWKLYVRFHGGPSPKAGRHSVHPGMNVPELLATLSGTPLSDDVGLTMVEGWRLVDADLFLATAKVIEAGEYIRAAQEPSRFKIPFPFQGKTLEGYLYPETYMVPVGKLDVNKLIQRQIDAFAERFYLPNRAEIENSGRNLHQLVVMASMLEREEPDPALRPQVAGVLYKRLDAKTPLGVDATSRYMLADWNDRKTFLAALRDPDEPYNTRLRAGLPPSPIGSASLPSLIGALRPVAGPYWYYLHDAQRRIHFARTAEEHEENRRKYNVY